MSLCRFFSWDSWDSWDSLSLFALSVRTFILVPFLLYLFLFCLQKEQPSIPPCVFFCSSPSKLVSFLSTLCLSLFSLYFFLYFSSKINTSYSSHLSVTRSTVFSVYCFWMIPHFGNFWVFFDIDGNDIFDDGIYFEWTIWEFTIK